MVSRSISTRRATTLAAAIWRFSAASPPRKRPDRAIKIARALGIPLKIAAKVDKADREYFETEIKPLLEEGGGVEFVGEVDERAKTKFLGEARALLFPIDWPEPFGLVMIEAMACGTPVLAFRHGSVPEVIDEGVTGKIVDTMDEAVAAMPQLLAMDRRKVRRRFEERFTAERMAHDYVDLYTKQIAMAGLPEVSGSPGVLKQADLGQRSADAEHPDPVTPRANCC